jgi:CxxC motif-containing protein
MPGLAEQSAMAEIVCIACPIGCRLTVEGREGEEIRVSGNRCPKGETYGREEVLSPRRVLTAVVRTDSAPFPYASVRTDKPLPRPLMTDLLSALLAREARLPVVRGAPLMKDFKGSGVNVVFTRTLPPDEVPPVG